MEHESGLSITFLLSGMVPRQMCIQKSCSESSVFVNSLAFVLGYDSFK